jgi:hypothetical protein
MKFLKLSEIVLPASAGDNSAYREETFYSDPGNDTVTRTFWQHAAHYVAYLWQRDGYHIASEMNMDTFVTRVCDFIGQPAYRSLNIVYTRGLTRNHLRHLFQLHAPLPSTSSTSLCGESLNLRRFALAMMCLLVPIPVTQPSLAETIELLFHELSDINLLTSYHGPLSRVQATNRLHASTHGPGACILRLAEPRVEAPDDLGIGASDSHSSSAATLSASPAALPIAYGLALVCSHTRYDQHDAHQLVTIASSTKSLSSASSAVPSTNYNNNDNNNQSQQPQQQPQQRLPSSVNNNNDNNNNKQQQQAGQHVNWIDQWRNDFLSLANSKTPSRRYHRRESISIATSSRAT